MVDLTLYSFFGWLSLVFVGLLALIAPVIAILENRQHKKNQKVSSGKFSEIGSGIYYFIRGGNQK